MTNHIKKIRFIPGELSALAIGLPPLAPLLAGKGAFSKNRTEVRNEILRRLKKRFPGLPY
jgi:hypothetical protein